MKIWTIFLWFETGTTSRVLHVYEPPGSLDCVNVLDMMSDCQLWRTIILRDVVNEKLIQELFIINFIELSLIVEYFFIVIPDHISLIFYGGRGVSVNKVLRKKPKWITVNQFIRRKKLFNNWPYYLLPLPCGLRWVTFLTFVRISYNRALFSAPHMNCRRYKSVVTRTSLYL